MGNTIPLPSPAIKNPDKINVEVSGGMKVTSNDPRVNIQKK